VPAYTIITTKSHERPDPFAVSVHTDDDQSVVEMSAMSPKHARMVAGALVMLLPKVDPAHSVVLDASFNGGELRRPVPAKD
jgi:hypothetical protein